MSRYESGIEVQATPDAVFAEVKESGNLPKYLPTVYQYVVKVYLTAL